MHFIDETILATPVARMGRFRCAPTHPSFEDSGPAEGHIVVFPRTGVWIRHLASSPFVADPNVVTIYNRGQEYTRRALAPDGDRCEWFGVSDDVALEIAITAGEGSRASEERPFRRAWTPCPSALYLRQRQVHASIAAGRLQGMAAESAVIEVVADALAPRALARVPRGRDVAMEAREILARDPLRPPPLSALAGMVGVSPFALCRAFRGATGSTLHGWQVDLRLRIALERLAAAPGEISRVAVECGFASHSHLVHWCRRRFGATPSRLAQVAHAA